MTKKSQVEIMGLTITIILILIGMIFAFKFIIKDNPLDYKKEFLKSELTTNTLYTLLRTTTECSALTMTELLQDCSQDKNIICSGKNSCEYFDDVAKKIFGETLEIWEIEYSFTVFNGGQIIKLGESCPFDKKSELFTVPTESEILSVKLDICG